MSTTETKSAFITRFDRIWTQARRVQLLQALCWSILTALAGIALLAVLDYWLELPHAVRISAVVLIGTASLLVAVSLTLKSVNRWRRQATAAAIEQVFPQLGQRIRTTVQYGPLTDGELAQEGVATTMVVALEEDTIQRAQPLPLDAVIPWKPLAVTSLLAAIVGLTLSGASATDWQWRAAAQRAFLGDEPYTRIVVKPGNLTVKEGESATVEIAVAGRTGRQVTFATRSLADPASEWELQPLEPEEPAVQDPGQVRGDPQLKFAVPLVRVREPLEYFVKAGSAVSDTFRVEVLYPLRIVNIRSTVQAPQYTGLPAAETDNGNIVGLVGSQATLQIELDRAPAVAWLEVQDLHRKAKDPAPPDKVPLTIDGVKLSAELSLTMDKTYTVMAKAADGMELHENKYRIRVRPDEAPQVWFESPAEALEVHTLAEVLMRIRVSDDFGLSRAGIMFEVNNEEEFPLLAEDFEVAAKELQATGKLSPKTRASLEKVLPLEHFQLSQQDSVMYYAYAEDNRPGSVQRTESDLRFIDLRPFRRLYRVIDPDAAMQQQQGPQLKSLEELIARQRYALNRTIQIGRRFKHSATPDLSGIDALIKFEAELAKSTRELAEGLEARGIDDTELLYQAETAMLGATDSLSAGKYDTATLQQRDALKYLIEGRNRVEIAIRKNPNRAQLAAVRQFDRMQQQKLRRPKSDEEEKREVAQRLDELADRQDFIYETLAGTNLKNGASKNPPRNTSGESGDKPLPNSENPTEGTSSNGQPNPEAKPDEEPPNANEKPASNGEGKAKPSTKPNETAKSDKPGGKSGSQLGDNPPKEGDNQKAGEDSGKAAPEGTNGGTGNKPTSDKQDSGNSNSDAAGEGAGTQPTTRELEDRQLDIALESREIEKLLGRLKGITDLSKERIAAAAKLAEETAQALGKGETNSAKGSAESTSKQFRELADQVKALLAEEQTERIAAAQQMAANLARQQQDFVDRLVKSEGQGGKGNPDPTNKNKPMPGVGDRQTARSASDTPMPGLGGQAEDIARQAQTLQDILKAASGATDPQDAESAKKVEGLIGSLKLDELTKRLESLPEQVGSGQMQDAKATAEDGAERMEAAAEQLSALQRSIVAPKIDELAKLEAKLAALDGQLDQLETSEKITEWHLAATSLLEEVDEAGISKELRQEFTDVMKGGGWSPNVRTQGWRWNRLSGGRYAAPDAYRAVIDRIQDDIRNRIQELMLGDLAFSRDEPIPPQYQELVDRFQQVLATEGKDRAKKPVARAPKEK